MTCNIEVFKTPFTEFHTLVWGDTGPKVLLLHGFPETPHIYEGLGELLSKQGFQVFAPFLPGYGPTSAIHEDTTITHLDDLAKSIAALSDAISEGHHISGKGKNQKEKITLVGHDWGAIAAYATAAYYPQGFSSMVTMSVPPPSVFLKGLLRHPIQLKRSSYILMFQLRANLPEFAICKNDYQLLKKLCLKWSGAAIESQSYFSTTAAPFDEIGNFTLPLGYYRGLFPLLSGSLSKWKRSYELAFTKLSLPSHIMVGELDGCIPKELYTRYQDAFTLPAEFSVIEKAGHFLPIDAPEKVAEIIARQAQTQRIRSE